MRLRLPMHGRDHRPGGADPIPGIGDGIRFNVDNQGQDDGSLEITARGEVTSSDAAIEINALAENGGAGDFDIFTEGNFTVTADAGLVLSDTAGNTLQISIAGFLFSLTDGETFVVNDHLGSPLVTYTG